MDGDQISDIEPLICPENIEEAFRRFREFVSVNRQDEDDLREASETLSSYLGFTKDARRTFLRLARTITDANRLDANSLLIGALLALLAADSALEVIPNEKILYSTELDG